MSYNPMQLAGAFIQAGELDDALDALDTALSAHPGDEAALSLRAQVLARFPGEDSARRALADLAALSQPTPDDALLAARLHAENGDLPAALAAIEDGLTRHPNNPRLTERLLGLLHAHGATAQARSVAGSLPADDWHWCVWRGDLAAAAGDEAAALDHYTAALDLISARYPLPDAPAAPLPEASTTSEAAALTIAGSAAHVLLCRAHLLRRQGRLSEADAAYTRAGWMLPADPAIPFYRGWIAALDGDLSRAISLAQPALDTMPPELRDSLLADLHTAATKAPPLADLRAALDGPGQDAPQPL